MGKSLLTFFCIGWVTWVSGQSIPKKILDHKELVSWNRIEQSLISNDGKWVSYQLKAEEGDPTLVLWNASNGASIKFERGNKAVFTADNTKLIYLVSPHQDSIKNRKRRKVKKEDMPGDTLIVFDLTSNTSISIPKVAKYQVPEKWSGWLFYQLEPEKSAKDTSVVEVDSLAIAAIVEEKEVEKVKPKKESKEAGTKLYILSLSDTSKMVIPFVTQFILAEKEPILAAQSSGDGEAWNPGVYRFDGKSKDIVLIWEKKEPIKKIAIDSKGLQFVATAHLDSIKSTTPPLGLYYWSAEVDSISCKTDDQANQLKKGWVLSPDATPTFSEDNSRIYFSFMPSPLEKDTSILEEEIAMVEVWHWQDGLLHTQQKVRAEQERKRSYQVCWNRNLGTMIEINNPDHPEITFGNEKNALHAVVYTDKPYQINISWEGSAAKDVYLKNIESGDIKLVDTEVQGNVQFSPLAKFLYWYSRPDSTWKVYSIEKGGYVDLKLPKDIAFYDEQFDMPDHPYPHGIAGWSEEDKWMLLYDQYDIWQIDPTGATDPKCLTNGRAEKVIFRYIRLDTEERSIPIKVGEWLLHTFHEGTKHGGYVMYDLQSSRIRSLMQGPYQYSRSPQKAKDANKVIYTRANFQEFPNLQLTDLSFKKSVNVSDANPQQKEYRWGTAELYEWISLDGTRLQGLLYKPENFDPKKQYPMIVNFYEKNSDNLYRHHAPSPGRSTINYAFYVSRGYIIFVPDIPYKDGYPGESAYNAVIPGVTSLIEKGFVAKDRIGVQGHSWGGYQIAYLLTRTNIFKCAESGAPVVNMTSAYGGIRWETGLSRMFQYERTQSRIGGTLWEYPLRYLENSPLFTMDKVNTPVLIMHNDKDGHVPWYQGIEYFVALRRLNKPAWMLNYNEEPHWPLKLENRKDFNIRMQQFFDHYLMDQPMPRWMERGVPAIEKGILQGYELIEE